MTEKVQVVSNADALFEAAVPTANKASADLQRRLNDERVLTDLLVKINAVRERLYAVRWNDSAEYVTKKRDAANLARELLRLEGEVRRVRADSLADFERSLALEGIGLDRNLLTKGHEPKQLDPESQTYLQDIESVANARSTVEESELENLKMMRVSSTEVLKDKSPADKWKYLYGQYAEWKHQTTTADAHYVATRKGVSTPLTDDEIVRLRGAIYNLKQRANLTQADKVLLQELQERLKAAHHHK